MFLVDGVTFHCEGYTRHPLYVLRSRGVEEEDKLYLGTNRNVHEKCSDVDTRIGKFFGGFARFRTLIKEIQ